MSFKVIIGESEIYELSIKISSLFKLFREIHIDYSQNDPIKLNNIDKSSFELVLKFCEMIQYNEINFPKPIYLKSNEIKKIIKSNSDLESFYEELNLNNISNLINTIDFLGFECLENLIYYKIYDELIFSMKHGYQNLSTVLKDKSEYEEIYEKYIKYCQKFVDTLLPEEINEYLENYS